MKNVRGIKRSILLIWMSCMTRGDFTGGGGETYFVLFHSPLEAFSLSSPLFLCVRWKEAKLVEIFLLCGNDSYEKRDLLYRKNRPRMTFPTFFGGRSKPSFADLQLPHLSLKAIGNERGSCDEIFYDPPTSLSHHNLFEILGQDATTSWNSPYPFSMFNWTPQNLFLNNKACSLCHKSAKYGSNFKAGVKQKALFPLFYSPESPFVQKCWCSPPLLPFPEKSPSPPPTGWVLPTTLITHDYWLGRREGTRPPLPLSIPAKKRAIFISMGWLIKDRGISDGAKSGSKILMVKVRATTYKICGNNKKLL